MVMFSCWGFYVLKGLFSRFRFCPPKSNLLEWPAWSFTNASQPKSKACLKLPSCSLLLLGWNSNVFDLPGCPDPALVPWVTSSHSLPLLTAPAALASSPVCGESQPTARSCAVLAAVLYGRSNLQGFSWLDLGNGPLSAQTSRLQRILPCPN